MLRAAEGNSRELSDRDMKKYIMKKIKRTDNTLMIDLKYFAKYSQTAGFKFSLDGIHNTRGEKAYVGTFSLNPPGSFY